MTNNRKERGYDTIFVNSKYYTDMVFRGYSVCGDILSDGKINQPEEKLYKLGYYSKTYECVSARFLHGELVDFVMLKAKGLDPNGKQGNGKIDETNIVYSDDKYILTFVDTTKGDALFVDSDNEEERRFYVVYYEEIEDTYNARNTSNTHIWYTQEGNIGFVFCKNNPSFNGLYKKHSNGTYFDTYISQDGKNIAFEFSSDYNKRKAMFIIKSKELIKRFGKEFASVDFLSSIFTVGNSEHVDVFSSEGEYEGKLFSISYKKPNHIEIEFYDDGEIIKEDDGEILVNYVKTIN